MIGTRIVVSLDFARWDQNVKFCDLRDKLLLLSGGFKERLVIVVLVISLTIVVIFCTLGEQKYECRVKIYKIIANIHSLSGPKHTTSMTI